MKNIKNRKEIKDTGKFSLVLGCPAKGCRHCIKGEKLVLFITGLCPRRCFYCPVSEKKFSRDDVYADEWKISNTSEMIEECRLIEAKGAGITGGDPLAVINKTINYIKLLKNKFGKNFHIHLYTSLNLATEENLKKLHDAGLDEIRFHPDLENSSLWPRLKLAEKFSWDIGIEIPAVPGFEKQTKKLFDFTAKNCRKLKFVNLNELEFSDTKAEHYKMNEMNFKSVDNQSYAVKGSAELAVKMIEYTYGKNYNFSVYFCTAKLKDSVQMKERIKRRAKNIALPFDEISKDGILIRGVVSGEINKLNEKLGEIQKIFGSKFCVYDKEKNRIITPKNLVKKYKNKIKQLGLIPCIVAEYPTKDAVEVEVEFL